MKSTHACEDAGSKKPGATEYKQHPLSAAFPSMPGHEIDALAADIKANGQREPAVVFEGQILDGWHRYRACDIAGVPLTIIEFPADGDPVAFVKSRNLHRRHLTDSQRASAVVACSKWAPTGRPTESDSAAAKKSAPPTSPQEKAAPGSAFSTTAELAREADVSERTIRQAKVAESAGLGQAVREGKVSAKRAAEIVKADPKIGKKIAAGKVTPEEAIEKAKPLPKILPRPKPAAQEKAPSGESNPGSTEIGASSDLRSADPSIDGCPSCAGLRAELELLKVDYDELFDNSKALAADLEAYMKVEEGADAIAKEIKTLKAQVEIANQRRDGLMTTNAEMVRTINHWKRRAEAAEKKLQQEAAAA